MALSPKVQTLTVTNFNGKLTREDHGDINSGLAKYDTTFGANPFPDPGNLVWFESPVQIDSAGSVITDLIVAAKERVESSLLYVYAIGHTGRLYKIQVNRTSPTNVNYDDPVLLTTLTASSPTFVKSCALDFFGTTERIYVGHDKGVTRVDFDGTNETVVGSFASYTADVPRPLRQFLGKLYFGNGSNIGEIGAGATVNTYAKLSPAFPNNTQVRDIDSSPDLNYLNIVVSRLNIQQVNATGLDPAISSVVESYVFKWNGVDNGYTAGNVYPLSLDSGTTFGVNEYAFGSDVFGGAVFNPVNKALSLPGAQSPYPNAAGSSGNLLFWAVPEYSGGFLKASSFMYGNIDQDAGSGLWRVFRASATSPALDSIRIPFQLLVANQVYGQSYDGYTGNLEGAAKLYFSAYEGKSGTDYWRFYKFLLNPTGTGTTIAGVYETQTQLFTRKVLPKEVRLYVEPLVANNEFTVDLIGSDGGSIPGSSKTFTVGSNATAGNDYLWYTPATAPTYAIGLRITNSGSANWTLTKAEIDYVPAGK